MTPEFRSALKSLHLNGRLFSVLTGVTDDTLARWGRRELASGGVQDVPKWAWLLVRAWQHDRTTLDAALDLVLAGLT